MQNPTAEALAFVRLRVNTTVLVLTVTPQEADVASSAKDELPRRSSRAIHFQQGVLAQNR